MSQLKHPAEVLSATRVTLGAPDGIRPTAEVLARLGRTGHQTMIDNDIDELLVTILREEDFALEGPMDAEVRPHKTPAGMDIILAQSAKDQGPIVAPGSDHESTTMYDRHDAVVVAEIEALVDAYREWSPP